MSRISSSTGFSLPEVLVAVTVFAFTAIALTSVLMLNVRTNREAKEKTVATSIGQSRIETFRVAAFSAPAVVSNQPDGTPVIVDGTSYNRYLTVATSGLPTGVAQVSVRVAWREPESPGVTLTTYVTY